MILISSNDISSLCGSRSDRMSSWYQRLALAAELYVSKSSKYTEFRDGWVLSQLGFYDISQSAVHLTLVRRREQCLLLSVHLCGLLGVSCSG